MPGLMEDLHFDKGQLGLLGSILYIMYGISKFASGVLSDRSNPRYFMAFGLMMTGVVTIIFGLSSAFWVFAVCWGINGWFQGFGWPPCARLLSHWYSQNERGSWWSICSTSNNVGAFCIPWIIGICMYFFDWRAAMYVPGVICILAGFFLINRLRDTPQSLGLPPIEQFRDDYGGLNKADFKEKELTTKEILVEYVLKNKYIWMLSLAYFFVYIVRTGVNDWTALFLNEQKGYGRLSANGFVSIFEVGGFFGSLSAGFVSDKLFSAKRGPVNILYTLGMLVAMLLFWWVPAGHPWLDSASIFTIGFMTFGPQMLIGMSAVELSHKKAASTANGFAGCFAYLGAACSGYPLGKITQELGWDAYFLSLVVCCGIAIMFLLPTWGVRANVRKPAATPADPVPALAEAKSS